MKNEKDIRDSQHWTFEDYKQRMTTKEWKQLLLHHEDTVIYNGLIRQLQAKKLGYGVVEVSKIPEKEKESKEKT